MFVYYRPIIYLPSESLFTIRVRTTFTLKRDNGMSTVGRLMVKPRVDWFKQGGDIHSLKMISWGIRKSANHAPTWLILPSGRKDKRQNSSDSGEIYSDRLLWRMSVVFNHCLRVICPDYPAHRALNHPGLTWFGDDCHWYFCINVHTWAKSSKKQTTAGCGFKTSSMVSLLLEKDDSNKSLPIYLGQMKVDQYVWFSWFQLG